MSNQDFLTLLFEAISLSFFALMSVEFVIELMARSQQIEMSEVAADKPQQVKLVEPTSESLFQLELPQQYSSDTKSGTNISDLRTQSEITSLKLREARIVAKRLGITQKVNGKDLSLNWLQQEIRQKLTSDRAVVISALQQLKVS